MGLLDKVLGTPSRPSASVPLTLDTPLLNFDEIVTQAGDGKLTNPWTLGHAFEGTQVLGETGSGKTSGSGRALATAFLTGRRFGGLVLTAKAGDLDDWLGVRSPNGHLVKPGFFHLAGRDPKRDVDYVIIGEDAHGVIGADAHCFNFLDHERSQGGDYTHLLVSLFLTAVQSGGDRDSHEDAYWTDALRQLLTNAIDLVLLATKGLTLTDIQEVIQSAPQSQETARSLTWQEKSKCWIFLEEAQRNLEKDSAAAAATGNADEIRRLAGRRRDFQQTVTYWLLDFAGLADRTRSVIVSSFTAKSTGLTRWPVYDMLCAKQTVDIVKATRDKRVVFLNLPVKRYAELGRFAQVLLKTVWQRSIERRPDPTNPVFLWADEAQFFVTAEDMLFQTTARSAGCATVFLSQNISNYYAVMNGRNGTAATDSLLGNLTTKIFHANGDPATNEWAERVFARDIQHLKSVSHQDAGLFDSNRSRSKQETFAPVVHAVEFTSLKKGGTRNKNEVEAWVFQGGRTWSSRSARGNAMKVTLRQAD